MLTNISNYLQNKFLARTRNKLMMNWSSESLMIQERRKREEIRISLWTRKGGREGSKGDSRAEMCSTRIFAP